MLLAFVQAGEAFIAFQSLCVKSLTTDLVLAMYEALIGSKGFSMGSSQTSLGSIALVGKYFGRSIYRSPKSTKQRYLQRGSITLQLSSDLFDTVLLP